MLLLSNTKPANLPALVIVVVSTNPELYSPPLVMPLCTTTSQQVKLTRLELRTILALELHLLFHTGSTLGYVNTEMLQHQLMTTTLII